VQDGILQGLDIQERFDMVHSRISLGVGYNIAQ
jgi:hypothetical protein